MTGREPISAELGQIARIDYVVLDQIRRVRIALRQPFCGKHTVIKEVHESIIEQVRRADPGVGCGEYAVT